MRKNAAAAPCSRAEYESLPEPLRRKCFSSLERLRIAEEDARQHPFSTCTPRPASAVSTAIHHSLTRAITRRRLHKSLRCSQDPFVAQADARFFLSLPPKVQRTAFSPEEQVLLVAGCNPSPLPHCSPLPDRRLDDFDFNFCDADTSPGAAPTRSPSPARSFSLFSAPSLSSTCLTDCSTPPDREADGESSLLYLDTMGRPSFDYYSSPSNFRRTMSLTSLPVRISTSSAPVTTDRPPLTRANASWHQRAHSHSTSGRRSSHAATPPVFDPEATHYRDPEARKKLRMYLASPQKFDEAVEFGFPSYPGQEPMPHRYQLPPITTDARNFSRDMHTFLRDETMSFLQDKDDDGEDDNNGLDSDGDSMADLESPVTPSSTGQSFRFHTRQQPSKNSSLDSNGVPLIHPIGGRFNREMTLRMTLTRPDLRADEDQLYGWQAQKGTKDDPFALEDLQLSDDMTGAKGPFYIKPKSGGNLVSRFFKRASRKGR
jgi:hypothetical protein